MYSTCIFCHRSLGGNDQIEHFPVGRKLAFDPARGRLWVVCAACGQWNLTPLEERWEAVEDCQRLFAAARRRVSTDHIGLARVAERIDLIRIGEPLRPEFAAWRYGDRFRARRWRAIAAGVGVLGVVAGATMFGAPGVATGGIGSMYVGLRRLFNRRSELARAERTLERMLAVRTGRVRGPIEVRIVPQADDDWLLRIESQNGQLDLRGSDALHTAHIVMPAINPQGGWPWSLRQAVSLLEEVRDPQRFFAKSVQLVRPRGLHHSPIDQFPSSIRLAIEMAAHEESERRAMQGELAALERAWREAEEIAAIADDMFLPASVTTTLDRLRRDARPRPTPE